MAAQYSIVSIDANQASLQDVAMPVGTPYRTIWLDDDLPIPLTHVRVRLDTGQGLRLRPGQILAVDDCVAPRGGIVVEWDAAVAGRIVLAIGGA